MPDGQGPVLEWRQETLRSSIIAGVILVLIGACIPTFNSTGFAWLTQWGWWLYLALCFVVGFAVFRGTWTAAGATWLQNGKAWVATYELTRIEVKASGTNQMLRLTDSAGRSIGSLKLMAVQRNQALWDLVYNGILHSVTTGKANPSPGSRKILKLPATRN